MYNNTKNLINEFMINKRQKKMTNEIIYNNAIFYRSLNIANVTYNQTLNIADLSNEHFINIPHD